MSVVEFALDSSNQQRIQVHLPAQQPAPITVMLNRTILGTLTSGEQPYGKDFRLPDNSFLNVRFDNGQPLVSRAGYPLQVIDAATVNEADLSPAAQARARNKKLGGCLVSWLVLNLVVVGIFTIINLTRIFQAVVIGILPVFYLLFSLTGIVGLVGLSLIFFWRKSGFYLTAAYVVLNFLLSILLHVLDARSFFPFITITILYVYLNRSGIWEKMS